MAIFISASMINDFLSCNRKVYYRINKPEGKIENREMIIGTLVHKAIEDYWNDKDSAISFLKKNISLQLPGDSLAIGTAENSINNFFFSFRHYLSDDDMIEKNFKIKFNQETFVVGKMDRISNGSVFDWKTDRNPPSDISLNPQFILYNWAYRNMFNSNPHGVYFGALSDGSIIRYKHTESAENLLIEQVIPDLIDSIKQKKFIPNGVFRKACFRCSYNKICSKE